MAAGVLFAAATSARLQTATPLAVAGLLALCVWLYDGLLKRTPAAPLLMGTCRLLNVLLGLRPPEGTATRELEDQALAAVGVTRAELAPLGRDLPGARRPVVVAVDLGDPPVADEGGGHLRLRFALPPGSYATVVVRALGVQGD
jgi:tRNA(Glu) U13 pseudouridine synthase TruD